MRIIAIGDVVSKQGCEYLRDTLPEIKREYSADAVIVNGENSAVGNGILPQSARHIFDSGADVITLGNHALRRQEIYDFLDENEFIIRPCNFHSSAPGRGSTILDMGSKRLGVINLQGVVYLDNNKNPFDAVDEEIEKLKAEGIKIILVDFHAEATSEKRALALYLDGKISVFFGTHTHVQTADEQILGGGTGYITDLGMTGPINSVLGVKSEIIINRLKDGDPSKFELADGKCMLCGCIFDIDTKNGRTVGIERIAIR